jgi:hypothetical protein
VCLGGTGVLLMLGKVLWGTLDTCKLGLGLERVGNSEPNLKLGAWILMRLRGRGYCVCV